MSADVWAGDVLVIGAGAAGALIADELRGECSVALVDQAGFGAEQSNHSHGYLHRGYIYISGGTGLARSLQHGARRWQQRFEALGQQPLHEGAAVAFADPVAARSARATWARAGLPVRRAPLPRGLDGDVLPDSFASGERAYDFTPMLTDLSRRLRASSALLQASVRRVHAADGRVAGVEAKTRDGWVTLRAHLYVLAAGASNAALLRGATRHRGRAVSRMSFMAVVAGRSLPEVSFILPGNDFYGLFVVSRPRPGGGNVWLISNFLSLGYDGHTDHARALWLRAVLRSLGRVAPALRDPELRWALYDAPKGELRDTPGVMGGHSWETFGLADLLAVSPTKLTLAPLLAADVAAVCRDRLVGMPGTASELEDGMLPVLPERWKGETLTPLATLLEQLDCPHAAQPLWQPPTVGGAAAVVEQAPA